MASQATKLLYLRLWKVSILSILCKLSSKVLCHGSKKLMFCIKCDLEQVWYKTYPFSCIISALTKHIFSWTLSAVSEPYTQNEPFIRASFQVVLLLIRMLTNTRVAPLPHFPLGMLPTPTFTYLIIFRDIVPPFFLHLACFLMSLGKIQYILLVFKILFLSPRQPAHKNERKQSHILSQCLLFFLLILTYFIWRDQAERVGCR